MGNNETKKFDWSANLLNPYVLIAMMIVIAATATYLVPAGVYERVVSDITGKMVIAPDTFHFVEQNPVNLLDIFGSVPQGMINNAQIIFFVLLIAGAFEILNSTGFTTALVGMVVRKCTGREKLIFPVIITIFAFLSGTIGMAEEVIVFIPIILTLCKSMGYDELVAVGLTYCGVRSGHIHGLMNPFTVGLAQSYAELPMYSGLGFRVGWCVITIAITTFFVYRYAMKVKSDPSKSLMHGIEQEHDLLDVESVSEFTATHKTLGALMVGTFALIIFGVYKYGWYLDELAAIFLAFGIVAGIVGRLSPSEIVSRFIDGAKNILGGALIVGVAGGIVVLMREGQIIDSIVFYTANALSDLPKLLAVNGMYVFQWLLNLLIPSGSAQAATTMPIVVPLSDILEINRQVAVSAFTLGSGVPDLLTPACGPLMAALAVAKVPYNIYLKWVMPILISWSLLGFVCISMAQMINYGPF